MPDPYKIGNLFRDYCLEEIMAISTSPTLVLASTSPYRKQLMDQLMIPYTVVAPEYEEIMDPQKTAEKLVLELSEGKARSVAYRFPNALIIGSDQVYEFNGALGGKAKTKEEAIAKLKRMRGSTQRFVTGYCILDTRDHHVDTGYEEIHVTLRNYSDSDIIHYVETGEAMDCAGSIKVEGKGIAFIESIQGDYFSLRGLPLISVVHILREKGIPFF